MAGVSQAAAEFLNFKMIDGPDGDSTSGGKKSDQNPNYAKLRTAVQFFHESQVIFLQ